MAIDGLTYVADFLTDEDERSLIAAIDGEPWLDDLWRRVQHYVYRYDYKNRSVDSSQKLGALPAWAQPVAQRLAANEYMATVPDQLIVNEYMPGQGIGAHVDAPAFGPVICSVSLGTPCVMDLTEVRGEGRESIVLAPRSLLVLGGEARHRWKHAIPVRESDRIGDTDVPRGRRVSMTFRTVPR